MSGYWLCRTICPINNNFPAFKIYVEVDWKTVWILISWLLMIWTYNDFKTENGCNKASKNYEGMYSSHSISAGYLNMFYSPSKFPNVHIRLGLIWQCPKQICVNLNHSKMWFHKTSPKIGSRQLRIGSVFVSALILPCVWDFCVLSWPWGYKTFFHSKWHPRWHAFFWWRLWNGCHYSCENRLEEVQGATASSHIPPPLLQDPWPCVQLLCAERHAPCQWNLATYQDEPAALATQW